jgi:hypothetical protein
MQRVAAITQSSSPMTGILTKLETASVSAGLDPGEASKVPALDRHRNTSAGLAPEHFQHRIGSVYSPPPDEGLRAAGALTGRLERSSRAIV